MKPRIMNGSVIRCRHKTCRQLHVVRSSNDRVVKITKRTFNFMTLLATPSPFFLSSILSVSITIPKNFGSVISPRLVLSRACFRFRVWGWNPYLLVCSTTSWNTQFVGVDRSVWSIDDCTMRGSKDATHSLMFSFTLSQDAWCFPLLLSYDCILSTQALFQSEREPGLPSR